MVLVDTPVSKTRAGAGLAGILTIFVVTGCGDADDGGASCEAVAPCGGDVVGTWVVESSCMSLPSSPFDEPECDGAVTGVAPNMSGTITFTSDGMLESDVTIAIASMFRFNDACTQALSGAPLTESLCSALPDSFSSQPEISNASCSFAGSACNCSITSNPEMFQSSESYTILDDQIVGADGSVGDYCVSGDTLTISFVGEAETVRMVMRRQS